MQMQSVFIGFRNINQNLEVDVGLFPREGKHRLYKETGNTTQLHLDLALKKNKDKLCTVEVFC